MRDQIAKRIRVNQFIWNLSNTFLGCKESKKLKTLFNQRDLQGMIPYFDRINAVASRTAAVKNPKYDEFLCILGDMKNFTW